MKLTIGATVLLLAGCLAALTAQAQDQDQARDQDDQALRIELGFHTSIWWVIQEQVETGVIQPGAKDLADQTASGFNFKQGRLYLRMASPDGKFEGLVNLRLEERTDVIDFWGAYHAAPGASFYLGQMKIPSTAEVLTPDHLTDFIARATFNKRVGDYSLSATPFTSPFIGVRTYNRDLGAAFKGSLPGPDQPIFSYFIMVGNGLGGNTFIGGEESPEFIYTNDFGEYFYGLRLDGYLQDWLRVGGHYNLNRHDKIILQDKKTTADLDRTSWSGDLTIKLPIGLRLEGFYGEGRIEDFWYSQDSIFDYTGWGAWAVQSLFNNSLELCFRYDTYSSENQDDGDHTFQNNLTFGINLRPNPWLRLQFNYVWKDTVNEFLDDTKDDIIYVNVQYIFDAALRP